MRKPKAEDLDFQMCFYEGIVKDNPDFAEALIALGEIYTKKGFYEKGLKIDKRLIKLRPDSSVAHYNLACSLSLMSDLTSSFKALKRAIELGYDDLIFMNGDPDLSNLRGDGRFKELIKMIQKESLAKPQAEPQARQTRG
jgi:tetratricopeptide (TPR) repeat protein